jgi:hypothetical protein
MVEEDVEDLPQESASQRIIIKTQVYDNLQKCCHIAHKTIPGETSGESPKRARFQRKFLADGLNSK